MFLGDAGSSLIGFVLAWTIIVLSQGDTQWIHPLVGLWVVAVPVFDTLSLIKRRWKIGRSPFTPDRNHLHYLLIDAGMSSYMTLSTILALSIIISSVGMVSVYTLGPAISLFLYGLVFLLFDYAVAHRLSRIVSESRNESDF